MLKRIESPGALIALADIKEHLRIRHNDSDALLPKLEKRAVGYFDGYAGVLGRALLTQKWTKTFPHFSRRMDLELGPLQAIESVTYFNTMNVEQTIAASSYLPQESARSPYVQFLDTFPLPTVFDRDDAVSITFTCGYGDDPEDVPEPIHAAVLLLIGTLHNEDAQVVIDETYELKFGIADLIAPFRRHM